MLRDYRWYPQAVRGTPIHAPDTQQKTHWTLKIKLTFHPNYHIILYYQISYKQALSEEQT